MRRDRYNKPGPAGPHSALGNLKLNTHIVAPRAKERIRTWRWAVSPVRLHALEGQDDTGLRCFVNLPQDSCPMRLWFAAFLRSRSSTLSPLSVNNPAFSSASLPAATREKSPTVHPFQFVPHRYTTAAFLRQQTSTRRGRNLHTFFFFLSSADPVSCAKKHALWVFKCCQISRNKIFSVLSNNIYFYTKVFLCGLFTYSRQKCDQICLFFFNARFCSF